jgi:hypothetical protein
MFFFSLGSRMWRATSWAIVLACAAGLAGCGRNGPLPPWPTFDLGNAAPPPGSDLGPTPLNDMGAPLVRSWEWVYPAATANPLRAVGGTSGSDLWLVGDFGTIVHWDGTRATVAHTTAPGDSFISVAATAPDDAWVAGRSSGGSILHWNGSAWSTAYSLATQTIHALAAGTKNVYATTATGDGGQGRIWTYRPPFGWSLSNAVASASILRDLFALPAPDRADTDMLFAVGDSGAVLWGENDSWTRGKPSTSDGVSDPFSSDKNYFGVWGATTSDVWAAFMSGSSLGFSHFDGKTWTVKQTLSLTCVEYNQPPDPPFDQGKRLVGLDANHILAEVNGLLAHCPPFEWNGTIWAQRPLDVTEPAQPALAAFGNHWYAVNASGELKVSASGTSWTPLPGPTRHDWLEHIAVTDDRVWSTSTEGNVTGALQPLLWSDSGWQGTSTPAVADGDYPTDLWALSANDVWLAGTLLDIGVQGMVMHWDGNAWSTPTSLPHSRHLTSIWADNDHDVWVAGSGDPHDDYSESCVVYHFDGTSWSNLPVPAHLASVETPALFGLGPDAVWITMLIGGQRAVWKWDGSSIQEVASLPNDLPSFGRPWATSADDVWIPGRPILHWDGSRWSTIASPTPDLYINAMYGTSRNDIWGVGTGPFGGAIWHYEKGQFVITLDVPWPLFGIAGSPHMLPWVVGGGGETLRLVEHAPTP